MTSLHNLAQKRGLGELHDSRFMSAEEKRKVLKQWESFLESGCSRDKFTKQLYNHLIMHCEFIAHYDIHGFYATYFENGDDTIHFLSQFDDSKGIPNSVEYGMTCWLTNEEYHDINIEMVRVAAKYIPVLTKIAGALQKSADIERARALLAKHGLALPQQDDVD